MDERDQAAGSAGEHELASEVSERIRAVISSAEAAANAVRHEAEQRAQVKRRIAEEEAQRIIEDARRDAEAFVAERIKRISELSDTVVERGERIVSQLDRAEQVRRQLQELADALGETAEELARELTPEEAAATSEPSSARDFALGRAAERGATATEHEPEAAEEAPAEEPASVVEEPASEVVDLGEQRRESAREEPSDDREPDERLGVRLVALQMAVAGGNRGDVEKHLRREFDVTDLDPILDDVFGAGSDSAKRVAWPSAGDGAA